MTEITVKPIEYITVDVKKWEDIPLAVKCSPSVNKAVDDNLMGYVSVNVDQAMKQLATVGDLLKVANAASHGFPCSVPIIGILADYQSLINDTVNTCSKFVYCSIAAINQHALALRVAPDYPQKALTLLSKTAEKAKEMAEISQKLVDFAASLVTKSTDALKLATDNQVTTMAEEKEVEKKQAELNAQAAKLKVEIEGLNEQIQEFKELADKAGKEAAEERKMSTILKIVGAVTQPLVQLAGPIISAYSGAGAAGAVSGAVGKLTGKETGKETGTGGGKDNAASEIKKKKDKLEKEEDEKKTELKENEDEIKKIDGGEQTPATKEKKEKLEARNKEIKEGLKSLGEAISNVTTEISNEYKERAAASADKEAEYMKLKSQYQDLKRQSNATLAENVEKLKTLAAEKNYLEVSIKSLELTITTMGRVRTIFDTTRLFWLQVKSHCESLSDISRIENLVDIADTPKYLVDFMNEIKSSGLNWLALASINYSAAMTITSVKKNFDEVMSNLPGKAEAEAIVQSCSDEITKALANENKQIEETQKKALEASKKPPQQA